MQYWQELLSLGIILGFAGLTATLNWWQSKKQWQTALRPLPGVDRIQQVVEEGLETGKPLHINIGQGQVGSAQTSASLAALATLEGIMPHAAIGSKTPLVTSGDGASVLLAQSVMRASYQENPHLQVPTNPTAAQLTGTTPLSYAAGASLVPGMYQPSANILLGQMGSEAILQTEAAHRAGISSLVASTDLLSQPINAITSEHSLFAEESLALPAYLQMRAARKAQFLAALQAQDILRVLFVVIMLAGALALTLQQVFGK